MLTQGSEKLEKELDILQVLRRLRDVDAIVQYLQDNDDFKEIQEKGRADYTIKIQNPKAANNDDNGEVEVRGPMGPSRRRSR